jgi:hypothetical protein
MIRPIDLDRTARNREREETHRDLGIRRATGEVRLGIEHRQCSGGLWRLWSGGQRAIDHDELESVDSEIDSVQ